MPVTVVVGGQFGSEGKGKVTLQLVRTARESDVTVVRVGGPNSGHTAYDKGRKKFILRQLPAGCIDRDVDVIFPAGSYIDIDVFFKEIRLLKFPLDRLFISSQAKIVLPEHKVWESQANLERSIGSTGSGVGGAVMASVARGATNFSLVSLDAEHCDPLRRFICNSTSLLRRKLQSRERVIIEGSQGFGLSLLDGGYWPKATARSTTASAALSEAGLSPLDVDDIYMVIRSFPIRVAGDSGPLHGECSWTDIAQSIGRADDIREYTTVTKKERRVGKFDAEQVKSAIASNNPTHIVMNHIDYIGSESELTDSHSNVRKFLAAVEEQIGQKIDYLGFSALDMQVNGEKLNCPP